MKRTLYTKILFFFIATLMVSGTTFCQGFGRDTTSSDTSTEFKLDAIEKLQGANSDVEAVAISPTGKILAAGGWDKKVYIYSLEEESFGTIIHVIEHHSSAILSLAFDKRGEYLVVGSNDHIVSTWNVDSAIKVKTYRHIQGVTSVAYGPSIRYVYSGSKDGQIKMWDAKDPKRTRTIDVKKSINSFLLSRDKRSIYVADESIVIKQYNLKGVEIGTLEGHIGNVNQIAISSNGAVLASASDDKTVIVWDLIKRREKLKFEGHTSKVNSVKITSDNKYVVSGDHSGTVLVWDITTGEVVRTFNNLGRSVRNIYMSRYMDVMAVASYEFTGTENVVYYVQTGMINTVLDNKRKQQEKKKKQQEYRDSVDEMLED